MKQKLIYLFSLMLLSIFGTSGALAETVTATWDFTGSTPTPETLTKVGVQSRATFYPSDNDVAALYVDALNGKLAYSSSGYAQFANGTILRVPVYSTDDIVTVTAYPGQFNFTVGGTAAAQNETVHTATSSEVSKGYVEIVATSGAYLNSITLETTATTAKNAAWNFYNEVPTTINGTYIENNTGTVVSSVSSISLDVDASSSKFQARGTDAWFTAGTILKVPVANKGDVVTIMAYSTSYDNYTVGGVDASGSDSPIFRYNATASDAENGYVSIVATDQSYIYAIAVQQIPAKELKKYTWKFDDYTGVSALEEGNSLNLEQTASSVQVSTSNDVALNYIAGTASASRIYKISSTEIGDASYTSYLYMGGGGSTSQRYFTTGTITGKGKLTIVYNTPASGTCTIYDATNTSSALATITPETSSVKTSSTIDCGEGMSLLIAHSAKCGIAAIIWEESSDEKESSTFALTSDSSVKIAIGGTSQITYENNAGDVIFESGKNSIATVSDSGLITGVAGGATTITVTDQGSDTVEEGSASVTVVVPYDLVSANEYTLGSSTYGFSDSSSNYYFTNGFSMSNSGGKGWGAGSLSGTGKYSAGVTYTINIPEGVTVSSATITGKSNYSTTQYAYWGELFGEDYSDEQLPQSDETAAEKTITFDGGATGTLTFKPKGNQVLFKIVLNADNREESDLAITSDASVSLDDVTTTSQITYTTSADDSSISYTSSNVKVATVSSTGLITAVANGTCTITVSQKGDANFKDDSKVVTVTVNNGVIASINISAIVNNQTGTLITASEISNKSEVSFGVNENSERVEADASDAILIVNGKYHSDHGLENVSFTVGVPGNVKISVGECTYSGGKITVKNSENEIVATKTPIKDCWKNDNTKVAVLYYEGNATTLTISGMSYCPYIAVESVDEVPATFTSQFYNGSTLVSTVETYEGTTLDVPAAPSTESGEVFIGWYTATDGTGTKATSATVPTADGIYYANILPITFTNDYLVVDNSGTDRKNGEHFLAALEYANTNSTQTNPVKIFIPNGTYDFGNVAGTTISGSYISFIGESMDGVVILTTPEEEGLSKADLLYNRGAHNYFQNLTLKNNYPYGNTTGRAAAFHDQGSFTIFKDCYLNSHQDTYYSHQVGKYYYFEGGKISGCVDYMCGNGKVFYEGVTLVNDNRSTYMTANSELYVYNNCIVENGGSTYHFGRSWDGNPTCIFLNTTLKDNGAKLGSTRWVEAGMNTIYGRAGEYGTKNAEGTDITPESNVITFTKGTTSLVQNTILTAEEAETYSYENFFSSANWDPASVAAQETVVKTSVVNNVVTVPEGIYLVEKDGNFVEIFNGTSYTFDNTGVYTLRKANERGGFGEAVKMASDAAAPVQDGETITLTVSANMQGYRAYVNTESNYTVDENTQVYLPVSKTNNEVNLEPIEIAVVPANTPVVLVTTAEPNTDGTYTITLTTTDADATAIDAVQYLQLTEEGVAVSGYRLGYKASSGVKFYKYVTSTPEAGKIYLNLEDLPEDNSNTGNYLKIAFEQEATGINEVSGVDAGSVNGKFVKNGKLVIIKNGKSYNAAGAVLE